MVKKSRSFIFSRHLQRLSLPLVNKESCVWAFIIFLALLFLLPYFLPGVTYLSLGPYLMVSLAVLGIAAFLRTHKGGLTAWTIITVGLTVKLFANYGIAGKPMFISNLLPGHIGAFIFTLIVAHWRAMSIKLDRAHKIIQKQASTDGLTGLPNHRTLMERLEQTVENACASNEPFSIIFLDGDHFKQVNDIHGHAAGDAVLRELGERTQSTLRRDDIVGRYGGEEFIVLLPKVDTAQASILAEYIRASIAAKPLATTLVSGGINVTASLGVATYPTDGATLSKLLQQADQAMYWAKKLGRNQVRTVAEVERTLQTQDYIAQTSDTIEFNETAAATFSIATS